MFKCIYIYKYHIIACELLIFNGAYIIQDYNCVAWDTMIHHVHVHHRASLCKFATCIHNRSEAMRYQEVSLNLKHAKLPLWLFLDAVKVKPEACQVFPQFQWNREISPAERIGCQIPYKESNACRSLTICFPSRGDDTILCRSGGIQPWKAILA